MYSQGIDCSMQRVFSASAFINNALKNKSRIRRRTGRIRTYVLVVCVFVNDTVFTPCSCGSSAPDRESFLNLFGSRFCGSICSGSKSHLGVLKVVWVRRMDDSKQELLRSAWLEGKKGSLNGREQAKAWALRESWKDSGKGEYGMNAYIAGKLLKQGGGSPGREALRRFFEKIDADDEWFPGKGNYEDAGRPAILTGLNRAAIARSAMTMKTNGIEPTYAKVVAACPKASLNPKTDQPFCRQVVYGVLQEDCYDDDPCLPWQHKARYSKKALTDDMRERRALFSEYILGLRHTEAWYYNNIVWTDLCNSIVPLCEKKANEMALSRKGKSGWQSPGSELSSLNLPGKPEALKQKGWNTMRIWWYPMLSRGKLHVDLFDHDFPGEVPQGAAILVEKVRAALNVRFQGADSKPGHVFTDRGRGFFEPDSGQITREYKQALAENGLRSFMGDNARTQPGRMQDLLLHETAVSWLRHRLERTLPNKCWEESREEYGRRLKRCCEEANKECDVEGLCHGLTKRMKKLEEAEGDRLPK